MRRTLRTRSALVLSLAVMIPNCVSTGTETDNPVGPDGIEIRRSALAYQAAVDVPAADRAALGHGLRAFSLDLFRATAASVAEDENLFLGVHGVASLLAMTSAGARGATEAELAAALGHGLAPDALHPAMNQLNQELCASVAGTSVRYDAIRSVWLAASRPTDTPFLDVLSQHYDTGIYLVDFAGDVAGARSSINDWIDQNTGGLIPELFGAEDLDARTELLLSSVAYLSAPWQHRFEPETTWIGEFRLADGDVVEVPLMSRTFEYPHVFDVDWRALELPFRDADMGMVFVLPNEGEFASLQVDFDAALMERIVAGLEVDRGDQLVRAVVPRFEFSSAVDLQTGLEALGVTSLFDSSAADLTGIDPDGGLYVAGLPHRSTVGVDEYGTTAAAAMGEVMIPMADTPQLWLDRPFLFFIYDHGTGSVLFVGRLLRPDGEARAPTEPPVAPTDVEIICGGLAQCPDRASTVEQCLSALADDDAAVLEQCADCVKLGVDQCRGRLPCEYFIGDVCEPATCADYCPAHVF
ncbi:MAG: serpin family protein [Polyangiaceae bacterium]|nr:serpin family protein [Polyangiaceae bacterium]